LLDGGFLILSTEEKENLIKESPESEKYIHRLYSADEFLNKKDRWCLWLKYADPKELKNIKTIQIRIENVKKFRLDSSRGKPNLWLIFQLY
jgi:hypothetical protein